MDIRIAALAARRRRTASKPDEGAGTACPTWPQIDCSRCDEHVFGRPGNR